MHFFTCNYSILSAKLKITAIMGENPEIQISEWHHNLCLKFKQNKDFVFDKKMYSCCDLFKLKKFDAIMSHYVKDQNSCKQLNCSKFAPNEKRERKD